MTEVIRYCRSCLQPIPADTRGVPTGYCSRSCATPNTPTPAEIRQRAADIRDSWPAKLEHVRRTGRLPTPYETPIVHLGDVLDVSPFDKRPWITAAT